VRLSASPTTIEAVSSGSGKVPDGAQARWASTSGHEAGPGDQPPLLPGPAEELTRALTWPAPEPRTELAEGERVGGHARGEERDLEGALGDPFGLADELVQPLPGDRAVALAVHVEAVGRAGRLPV